MSITLSTTRAPVSIDLTLASPTTHASISPFIQPRLVQSPQSSQREPPAKKRRVEEEAEPPAWDLKACMRQHLLPCVERAVGGLSRDEYCVDSIAIQAVSILLKATGFQEKVQLSHGLLSAEDSADIERRTVQVVEQLRSRPQYRVLESPSVRETPIAAPTTHLQPIVPTSILRTQQTANHIPRQPLRRRLVPKPNTSPVTSRWSQLQHRPYLRYTTRQDIAQTVNRSIDGPHGPHGTTQFPDVYHVDFSSLELAEIVQVVERHLLQRFPRTRKGLLQIIRQHDVTLIVGNSISRRTQQDIRNFCSDLSAGKASPAHDSQVLSLDKDSPEKKAKNRRANHLPSLLLARELEGNIGFGRMRRYENFQNEFQICHQDGLSLIAEFTNCAGDISAMSWLPSDNVICGTTAHSDAHNQQYNKPGNLLLCSTNKGTLRAFPDHRIPRPMVERGENSTDAMRQSQDPWLYSSVVSTDYDEQNNWAFTSSFDKTVKVWRVTPDPDSMAAIATWNHQGNVNFVVAAKDGSGRVATAADVPTQAIRIYTVDPKNVQDSHYDTISCTRKDADGSDKWAYFPATMQWGPSPGTYHLLAIGYSPRSFTSDDGDIPEDKIHSGEIVLWDAKRRCQVPVLTATTANVFEILWHPTFPVFVVATSPSGLNIEHGVRTHVHIFHLDRERNDGAYSEFQKLDCYASDINELTIISNSARYCYVTAACTDGRVYVWDTAQGDRPIHILKHGYPLDAFISDREKEDTGVKFTAWGATSDRFYTGSSDGVVKVWNVRRKRNPFVRNLLEAPGPISCGVFSPNHSKLVIGDATGRVFVFSVDDEDEIESHLTTIPGTDRRVRRPKPFIPHPEPEPPTDSGTQQALQDTSIAQYSRQHYLASDQLVLHPNPVIGAIQGPGYVSTGLFRLDAHAWFDSQGPLLPEFERIQRETIHAGLGPRTRSLGRLRDPAEHAALHKARHEENVAKDLDIGALEPGLYSELVNLAAQLNFDGEEGWDFVYEEMPVEVD